MTTSSPASMGGPLSEADRLRAENASLSDQLDQVHAELAETRKALDSRKASHRDYIDASKAYCKDVEQQRDAARARVGVLEGQLATARERHTLERVAALIDPEAWRHIDPHSADLFEELGARAEYEANFSEAVRQRREPSLAAAERVIALFEDSRALGLDGGGSNAA